MKSVPTYKHRSSYKNYIKVKERELYRSVNSSINDLLSILPSHHKKPVKYQSKAVIVTKCTRYIEYLLICAWCLADECQIVQEEILQCLTLEGLRLSDEVLQLLNFFRPLNCQLELNNNVKNCIDSNSGIFHATFLQNTKRRTAAKCQKIILDEEKEKTTIKQSKYLKTSKKNVSTQTVENIDEFVKRIIKKVKLERRKTQQTSIEEASVDDWLRELFKNSGRGSNSGGAGLNFDGLTDNRIEADRMPLGEPSFDPISCLTSFKLKSVEESNVCDQLICSCDTETITEHDAEQPITFLLDCPLSLLPSNPNTPEPVTESAPASGFRSLQLLHCDAESRDLNSELKPSLSSFSASVFPIGSEISSSANDLLFADDQEKTSSLSLGNYELDYLLSTTCPATKLESGCSGSFLSVEDNISFANYDASPVKGTNESKNDDLTMEGQPFSPSIFLNHS